MYNFVFWVRRLSLQTNCLSKCSHLIGQCSLLPLNNQNTLPVSSCSSTTSDINSFQPLCYPTHTSTTTSGIQFSSPCLLQHRHPNRQNKRQCPVQAILLTKTSPYLDMDFSQREPKYLALSKSTMC